MKRILLVLTVAAMFVVAMTFAAVPAFAGPENLCENHPEHKQCQTRNPGGQEGGCPPTSNNPNCTTVRDNPSPNN